MTEVPEGYKRCSKCGEIKQVGEFHTDNAAPDGLQYNCKTCCKKYRRKYYREHKEIVLEFNKKYSKCVKKPSCPAVGGYGAEFVILICPICGKEFRQLKSTVDYHYEKYGQTHFYCSRECLRESKRKSHKTEYEKNIKRIRKEQRL